LAEQQYDVVVIGSGPGGYVAGIRAGQLGMKVAVIEKDPFVGGTCLHRGCIPTKALLENADIWTKIQKSKEFGITVGDVHLDWNVVQTRKQGVVDANAKGVEFLFKKNKVERITGFGKLAGNGIVEVDGKTLNTKNVILAMGSVPRDLPHIKADGKRIINSDHILKLGEMPKSMLVIGAGAVGCEFASMYHDLGTKVTLLEYFPQIVPLEDREVSQALERSFSRRGISVMTNARFDSTKVDVTKDGVCLVVGPEGKEPQELRAEQLLVAAGRATNVEEIGLETTKVEVDKGIVKVDGRMRTKEPHVYAIGDIVGGLMLAHTAAHEGIVAAHTIAGDKDVHPIDYVKQPRATYCRPEIASIGLTQQQAEERGRPIKTGKVPFQAIAKAIIGGEYEGFAKVIADKETDETLGIHLIGPHATDLIAEASVAFELEAVPWEIGGATHPHPTLSEILGEAAMAVDGRSINF
jgi:dihydrolipoamide dehydrogenase